MLDLLRDNPIAGVIVACEVGLWIFLVAGLLLRYAARLPRTGVVVLACIPLLDLVLLVASAADLYRGADPGAEHGLAAVYLGVSLAFGHAIIRGADSWFAHWFAGGDRPVRPAKGTPARIAALWAEWRRVVVAAVIATVTLGVLVVTVVDAGEGDVLLAWIGRVWMVVGLWLAFGPVWEYGAQRSSGDVR